MVVREAVGIGLRGREQQEPDVFVDVRAEQDSLCRLEVAATALQVGDAADSPLRVDVHLCNACQRNDLEVAGLLRLWNEVDVRLRLGSRPAACPAAKAAIGAARKAVLGLRANTGRPRVGLQTE